MKRIFTKLIIVVSILGFVNQPFFVPRTHAQWVVFNPTQTTKEYGLDAFAKVFLQRFLNKIVNSTLSWAAGGFDGEPSFISNWDDFLKDVEKDAIEIGLDYALYKGQARLGDLSKDLQNKRAICEAEVYDKLRRQYSATVNLPSNEMGVMDLNGGSHTVTYNSGNNTTLQGDIPEDVLANEIKKECGSEIKGKSVHALAQAARDNFMRYNSGGGLDARYAAITIAKYGAKELNSDPLKDSIDEERPLNKLLGRGGRMDYKSDFSKGGWLAYIAQSGDNPIVNHSKIINKVSEKMKDAVKKKADEIKTPNKHLDKVKCTKGKDENGKCKTGGLKDKGTEKEGKSQIVTDKQTIGAKTDDASTSGEKQSRLADEFTEVLVDAAQKLATGLITIGAQRLVSDISRSKSKGNAFYDQLKDFATTQDDYDVLGIDADANLSNNAQNNENNNNSNSGYSGGGGNDIYNALAGDDASIQYIGGPEDVDRDNFSLTDGPEKIVDLRKVLGKKLALTKAYLDELVKARIILNRSISYSSTLDHCLPGPDLGWEDRYKRKVRWIRSNKFDNTDDEDCEPIHAVADQWLGEGFTLTKEMSMDPFLNIPGSQQLRSTIQSLTGGDVTKALEGVSGDISEKRRAYVALLNTRELITERMEKIRKGLGITVELPLFEDQVVEEKMDEAAAKVVTDIVEGEKNGGNYYTNNNSGGNTTGGSSSGIDNGNHALPGSITKFDLIADISNRIKRRSDDNRLIKLPRLSEYNLTTTEWKISDKDLLSILKLPASLVDKKAKPEELLVENLGLYIFKKKTASQKANSNTVVAVTKKEVVTETPEELVANNKKKAAELALDLSWALWRKFAPRGEKARARYQYDILDTNGKLVSEKDYLSAQLNLKNLSSASEKAVAYAKDCITFVNKFHNKYDREIDPILEQEYQKQQNKEESIFVTDLFTSPSHRKTSILKFYPSRGAGIKKYYNDIYPGRRSSNSAYNIRDLFKKDKTLRTLHGISPKRIDVDRKAMKWSIAVPAVGVAKLFEGSSPISIISDPNYGKNLFCNGKGVTYKGKCWDGHSMDICSASGTRKGQTWYYSSRSVYRAAVSKIMSSAY